MRKDLQIGSDPNNTGWANDTSKFGMRLMMKMGWSEGKGLGANEDGMTSHVKTVKNVEMRGVGCDAKTSDNWLQNAVGFSDLLNRLNASASTTKASSAAVVPDVDDDEEEEEEQKVQPTQKSLPRHLIYAKRHKQKQRAVGNREDLDAILGNSRKSKDADDDDDSAEAEDAGGMLRTSAKSIDDYFQSRTSFSINRSEEITETDEEVTNENSEPTKKKKKKKQRLVEEEEIEVVPAEETIEETVVVVDEANNEGKRKKKKKKKELRADFEPAEEVQEDAEEEEKPKKKQKSIAADPDDEELEEGLRADSSRKKKKKKKGGAKLD